MCCEHGSERMHRVLYWHKERRGQFYGANQEVNHRYYIQGNTFSWIYYWNISRYVGTVGRVGYLLYVYWSYFFHKRISVWFSSQVSGSNVLLEESPSLHPDTIDQAKTIIHSSWLWVIFKVTWEGALGEGDDFQKKLSEKGFPLWFKKKIIREKCFFLPLDVEMFRAVTVILWPRGQRRENCIEANPEPCHYWVDELIIPRAVYPIFCVW